MAEAVLEGGGAELGGAEAPIRGGRLRRILSDASVIAGENPGRANRSVAWAQSSGKNPTGKPLGRMGPGQRRKALTGKPLG